MHFFTKVFGFTKGYSIKRIKFKSILYYFAIIWNFWVLQCVKRLSWLKHWNFYYFFATYFYCICFTFFYSWTGFHEWNNETLIISFQHTFSVFVSLFFYSWKVFINETLVFLCNILLLYLFHFFPICDYDWMKVN